MQAIEDIIRENERRLKELEAPYDPVTGEELAELLGEKRARLVISDFAVPVQLVPAEMMEVPLIRKIAKAGSIERFLETHKFKNGTPSYIDIERKIRSIRHKYDFCNWAYWCIKIDAKLGGTIRFKLNKAQLIVLSELEDLRRSGVPINIVICKARQWGGSTLCLFYQMWLMFKWDHYHSFVVAAHVSGAAATIMNMLSNALKTYPVWDIGIEEAIHLAPSAKQGNGYVIKNEHMEQVFPAVIYIGSAQNPDSLRSSNISGAHYSEVGIWPNTPQMTPQKLLASISGGITIKKKHTMQAWESSATVSDDYFYDIYTQAKNGDSTSKAVFIPWFYILYDTLPVNDIEAFARWLYENKDNDQPDGMFKSAGKYYWWLWEHGATFEGINWYRYTELTKSSRIEMLNEAPSSDLEAFQSSGQKVFNFYDVERMRSGCRKPIRVGELVSDDRTGASVLRNIQFIPTPGGHLWIYEEPDDSPVRDRYAVVVDIGGVNSTSDFSSIRVFDRLMLMPDFGLAGKVGVVAEIHYHADHDMVAYDAMRLAEYYNHALLVIESNTLETKDKPGDNNGFEYILDIVSDIYNNLYARHNKEEDMKDGIIRKWGFHTNVSTKPKIIDNMRICLRDGLWDEPSELCCQEMSIYIEERGKMTAPAGKHDDVLMATAIGLWITLKEMPVPTWIKKEHPRSKKIVSDNNIAVL